MHRVTVYRLRNESDLDFVCRTSALGALFLEEDERLMLTGPDPEDDSGQLLSQRQYVNVRPTRSKQL